MKMMKKILILILCLGILFSVAGCTVNMKTESVILEGQRVTITLRNTDGYTFDLDGADINFSKKNDEIATGTFYKESHFKHNIAAIEIAYDEVVSETSDGYNYTFYKCKSKTATPQHMVLITYDKNTHLIIKTDENIDTMKNILSGFSIK